MSDSRGRINLHFQSGERLAKATPGRSPDLQYAIDRYTNRWSAAAIAAACTLPETTRSGVLEWAELLDRLDDAIRDAVYG